MDSAINIIKGIIIIVAFPTLVCSCEQIISVNLQDEQPNLVIDGYVTDGRGPFLIKLSESQAYYNQSDFGGIENALVQMNDSNTTETLVDKGSGYYSTKRLRGIPGRHYQLNVTVRDQKYNASVQLPPPVSIDTVYFNTSVFNNDSLNAYIEFNDPFGIENFYRIKLYRNGKVAVNEYYLVTDVSSDGQRLVVPILYSEFAPGDSVVAELDNLERSTWRYLKGLSEIIQQGVNVQAPGNPPSNISGGALGYFGAWGVSKYKVFIHN